MLHLPSCSQTHISIMDNAKIPLEFLKINIQVFFIPIYGNYDNLEDSENTKYINNR